MCHCKEPTKAGWTHEEACCYNTAAMGRLFEPRTNKGGES